MLRTQVYLTKKERDGLDNVASATGRKQSELIREAIDRFLDSSEERHREIALREAAGLWRDRHDLPDFSDTRRSWDRN
ncbi:MAG: ribbon-helix-helix protein, CopG family [Victivallales bacterium]|nr:ribbon-helix-helix protein, CopG family [Victivallales bacterium]